MVAAETPAFDKSSTEEYGRPPMIFFAVAGPTPGKLSRSFSLDVFRSTFAFVSAAFAVVAVGVDLDGGVVAVFVDADAVDLPPADTRGVIFLIVAAEMPAFDKSPTEE